MLFFTLPLLRQIGLFSAILLGNIVQDVVAHLGAAAAQEHGRKQQQRLNTYVFLQETHPMQPPLCIG